MNSLKTILIFSIGFVYSTMLYAQLPEDPPRPLEIHIIENLHFGRVVLGDGNVIVPGDGGSRVTTGDVIPLGSNYSSALFDVHANSGTVIRLDLNSGSSFSLQHDQTSATFTCNLSDAYLLNGVVTHNQTFTVPIGYNTVEVQIGGTLQLSSSNPEGSYFGSFFVGVIYE